MQTYEINEGTVALLPVSKNQTKVYEDEEELEINKTPYEIMEESCAYFGSTYAGRQVGAQTILGNGYKVPIIVEESKDMIFFPTLSPTSSSCWWLALNHIEKVEKVGENTKIHFDTGLELIIPISYRSLQNQLLRATRLQTILKKRKQ